MHRRVAKALVTRDGHDATAGSGYGRPGSSRDGVRQRQHQEPAIDENPSLAPFVTASQWALHSPPPGLRRCCKGSRPIPAAETL